MKKRIRNKAYDCAHHVYEDFLVTDDPYPIHNTEDYCKLGKYDNTWLAPEKKVSLCEHCKRFCASRPMIRKQRERKAFLKEVERDWKRNYCALFVLGLLKKITVQLVWIWCYESKTIKETTQACLQGNRDAVLCG